MSRIPVALFTHIITVLMLLLPGLTAVRAQQPTPQTQPPGTGRISGRVTDQRGAAISGAVVRAQPLAAVSSAVITTDSSGEFTLPVVPAGEYELRVSADGFATQTLRITVGSDPSSAVTADFTLAPAQIGEMITVTPARTELRIDDLPASVSVLDAGDVSNAAAQTVDDLLRQIPGFSNFRRSSSIVANPTTQGVSLRGAGASGASRTLVLSDGLPLNDAFGGWVYWDRVPREEIDRIELVRGGASDLYGSDALSGVINLISRPASQPVVAAEAGFGNRDTADTSFFAARRFGSFSAALSGEALRTDGYFIVAPEVRGPADEQAGQRHRSLNLRLGYEWNAESSVFLRGSLFDEDRRNGTRLQRNDTKSESLAAGGRFRTPDGSSWNMTAFARQQRFHQNFTAVASDRATESLTRLQAVPSRDVGVNFSWSRLSGERHLLVAGLDVRGVRGTSDETGFFNGRANSLSSSGGRQRRLGIFAQDIISLSSRWQLTLSSRYDHWRDSSAASVTRSLTSGAVTPVFFPARSEDAFSPRVALLFRINDQLAWRASGYRAFRAPTLNELYRGFRVGNVITLPNENLSSERLTGGETGLSWQAADNLTTRLTWYFTEISRPVTNFTITVTPSLITRQRRNLGRTRSQGIEAEADLRLAERWKLTAGYLFADATFSATRESPDLSGNQLPQVPRHQFTLQAAYTHPSVISAAIQFRASGRQFDDDQNQLPLESFALLDAMISRRLGKYVDVFFAVQNLLDQRYTVGRTPIETIGAPALWRGGLRFSFER